MPIIHSRKYKCKKCGNTFVTSEGDVITGTFTCQECGGTLKWDEMSILDKINPLERLKLVRHDVKSLFSKVIK